MPDVPASAPATSAPATSSTSAPAPAAANQPNNLTPAARTDSAATPAPGQLGAPKPPTPAERRKYSLKVDGKEQVLDLTDDEISVRLQKGWAAEKRMQEAAQERARVAKALEFFKRDPFAAAKELEVDLDKLAEERIVKRLQMETLPPEQRERMELAERVKAQEAEIKAFKEAQAKAAQEQLERQVFQQTEKIFIEALKQEGVEPSQETLYEMAALAKANLDYGIELGPRHLAAEVKARVADAKSRLEKSVRSGLKGEALLQYLGDETVNEILQAAVAKVKGNQAPQIEPPKQRAERQVEHKDPFEERQARQARSMMEWQKMKRGLQ